MKILIATPCAGDQVHRKYLHSLLTQTFNHEGRLADQQKYDLALYTVAGVSGLGKDRGVMASYALRNGFDKIFFIDADQSWNWDQFKKLVDSNQPIIAGVVALKSYPIQLNFVPMVEDKDAFELEDGKIMASGLERLFQKHNRNPEIPVQGLGTAFLCIDCNVLRTLAANKAAPAFIYQDAHTKQRVTCWDFFQSGVVENLYIGEDFGFCFQAARSGFIPRINAEVHVDHHGAHTYTIGSQLRSPLDQP